MFVSPFQYARAEEYIRLYRVPACVGVADTKTRVKLANFLAKRRPAFGGVCDLRDPAARLAGAFGMTIK